jgi:hypothetical protein
MRPCRKGVLLCLRTVSSNRNPLPSHRKNNGPPWALSPFREQPRCFLLLFRCSTPSISLSASIRPTSFCLCHRSPLFKSNPSRHPQLLHLRQHQPLLRIQTVPFRLSPTRSSKTILTTDLLLQSPLVKVCGQTLGSPTLSLRQIMVRQSPWLPLTRPRE